MLYFGGIIFISKHESYQTKIEIGLFEWSSDAYFYFRNNLYSDYFWFYFSLYVKIFFDWVSDKERTIY